MRKYHNLYKNYSVQNPKTNIKLNQVGSVNFCVNGYDMDARRLIKNYYARENRVRH